jgi:hypothetical protein
MEIMKTADGDALCEDEVIEYIDFLIRKKNYTIAMEFLSRLQPSPLRLLLTDKVFRHNLWSSPRVLQNNVCIPSPTVAFRPIK